jgi:hypothetical protein
MKADHFYLYSVICLMFLCPVLSIAMDSQISGNIPLLLLAGKWFVFWAVGVRFLTAGARQVLNPGFTLEKIFHIHSTESHVLVRELGFANICLGTLGILSLFFAQFRIASAITGGLFLGLAGIMHAVRKPAFRNESIAMVSNLFVFAILLLYVLTCTLYH